MTSVSAEGVGFALLGLVVGSFLNTCIHRLPRGNSVVYPPPHCQSCNSSIRWFDNLPIISYTLLNRRCRECGSAISAVYPCIEAVTAIVFVVHYLVFGLVPVLLVKLVFSSILIVLFVTDLSHRVLPNSVTIPGLIFGWCSSLVLPPGWLDASIGVIGGGGFLFALSEAYYRVRGRDGLGMGDVKMLALVGAFLGWKLMLATALMASILGSLVGIAMLVFGRANADYALPFGSFLSISAVLMSVCGIEIISWYESLLLNSIVQ